jgi:aspartate carbamoyltransferase regulatory subunit
MTRNYEIGDIVRVKLPSYRTECIGVSNNNLFIITDNMKFVDGVTIKSTINTCGCNYCNHYYNIGKSIDICFIELIETRLQRERTIKIKQLLEYEKL